MRSELVKLSAPFLVSQILYWKLFYIPTDQPGLWTAFIKCLPVSTLALYLGNSTSKNSLIQGLFWGMIFSIGGDFCLVYSDLFLLGMLFFLAAQISFIKAFGWEPLKPLIGASVAIILTLILSLMLLPNISDFGLKLGFPLYSTFLGAMGWRALARMDQGMIEKLTGLGSLLFLISDGCIGINMFYVKLPRAQEIIMSTYYLAQFLITLSACKVIDKEKKDK